MVKLPLTLPPENTTFQEAQSIIGEKNYPITPQNPKQ